VTSRSGERVARNEDIFHEVSERIREQPEDFPASSLNFIEFLCECSRTDCAERLVMTLEEYESVRAEPARFAVAPDHVEPEHERLVAQTERFAVAEVARLRALLEERDAEPAEQPAKREEERAFADWREAGLEWSLDPRLAPDEEAEGEPVPERPREVVGANDASALREEAPGHLLFVPVSGGYSLLERAGPPPEVGSEVDLGPVGAARFLVSKLGRSPLPLDPRLCAYLLRQP
jgi:hypothetical protein